MSFLIFYSPQSSGKLSAEDDIAFLLNRGELVDRHILVHVIIWHTVKLVCNTSIIFINTESVFLKMFSLFSWNKTNSYCTSANIKIFFLVQYRNDIWKNHILTVLITLMKKRYLLLYNKRVIAWIFVNIVPRSVSYCTRTLAQYDILLGILKYC